MNTEQTWTKVVGTKSVSCTSAGVTVDLSQTVEGVISCHGDTPKRAVMGKLNDKNIGVIQIKESFFFAMYLWHSEGMSTLIIGNSLEVTDMFTKMGHQMRCHEGARRNEQRR